MARKKKTSTKTSDRTVETVRELRKIQERLAGDLTIAELARALKTLRGAAEVPLEEPRYREELGQRNLACLKKSLQAAVTLEFATVPPYLSMLWSIKDELHPAAKSIREVVQQEMLHMALACNMLTSLGATPQINTVVPEYPSGLPGGVHEGLVVSLSGLTKEALTDFLWIERPVKEVPIEHPYGKGKSFGFEHEEEFERDNTIGEFYEEIRHAFETYLADPNNPRLSPDDQVTGPLAYAVIRDMDNVNYAIDLIQHQGEGSESNPEDTEGELSHYYRFLEVYDGKRYRWNPDRKVLEVEGELEFPEVWPTAKVPKGGYRQEDVSEEVWYYLDEFDKTYSKLVDQIQGAWTLGGQASLVHAYETMFALEDYAKPLMKTRTPYGGGETYGPCWRYKKA